MKKTAFIRILCLVLCLAFVMSVFTGCSKNGNTSEQTSVVEGEDTGVNRKVADGTQTTGETTTSTTTKSTGGKVTSGKGKSYSRTEFLAQMPASARGKTFIIFLGEDLKNRQYGDAIRDFEKKTGITVKTEISNKATYASQLAAKIASGKSPDLYRLIYNNTDNVKNMQPLTSSGYDFQDDGWDKDLMKEFTFDGICYGTNVKNTLSRNMLILLYNKKALKKADMQDPYEIWKKNKNDWTWSKFWSMCEEFVKANHNKEGYFGLTCGVEDAYLRCFNAGMFGYDSDKGQWVSYIKDANSVARYEELVSKIDSKLVTPAYDSDSFKMGYTLFNFSYSSAMEKDYTGYSQLEGNLGCVPVPTDSTHQPLFEYMAYGIPIGSKNAEIVPYFLRYVFDPSSYDADTFYKDKQASEVIQYMTKIEKTSHSHGYSWELWNKLTSSSASQVRSVLDSYAGAAQDYCDNFNAIIPTLQK